MKVATCSMLENQIKDAEQYLQDFKILESNGSRNAVTFLLKAANQALIASIGLEGKHIDRKIIYQLDAMVNMLSEDNSLKAMFRHIECLTAYGSSFYYATSLGHIRPVPSPEKLTSWQIVIEQIIVECKKKISRS